MPTTERRSAARVSAPEKLPGHAAAIHSMGTVAAPLLAGFSLTLVLYTVTATEAFRWPNLVLALIMGAALALIVVVQCTAVARLYAPHEGAPVPHWEQAHRRWARRSELLYSVGILLLLAGLAVALVPPPEAGALGGRLAAIAVAVAGLLAAALWIAAPRNGWIARRFLDDGPAPADASGGVPSHPPA